MGPSEAHVSLVRSRHRRLTRGPHTRRPPARAVEAPVPLLRAPPGFCCRCCCSLPPAAAAMRWLSRPALAMRRHSAAPASSPICRKVGGWGEWVRRGQGR